MAAHEPAGPTRDDVDALALALPEVTREGTAEHPAYAVRGKTFLLWRGPRKDAVDPDTGERLPDVIAIAVPGADDKEAILQSGPPWFTTPHFDGYAYVLVRERDLPLPRRGRARRGHHRRLGQPCAEAAGEGHAGLTPGSTGNTP